jgi:TnpA family transposase
MIIRHSFSLITKNVYLYGLFNEFLRSWGYRFSSGCRQLYRLFSHFIPCGVWEAVYIIEGLLQNKSDIQPDTVHADTQGQSYPVFALAHLLGIKLMPRIRNVKDRSFFRPTPETTYKHIDTY